MQFHGKRKVFHQNKRLKHGRRQAGECQIIAPIGAALMRMPNILQLERQLEKELDEMPAEDLDDDAYDEYDLIVIPDQGKGSPQQGHSESPQQEEEHKSEELRQRSRPTWPPSSAGGDMTTIELISSDDEPSVEETEGGNAADRGRARNDSSSSSDDVGVIEGSELESNSEVSSDSDSDSDNAGGGNQLERSYQELNALPSKKFAQMVSLIGIAL